MMRLLHIEWNKIFYNKGTRIFLILYFVLIALMGYFLPKFNPNINGIEINFIELGALNFPVIWHNTTWLIGFGKFFLAVIIINNISNEYTYGTIKQNIIDGLSRIDFLKSKIYINLLITLLSTLLVVLITLGLGFSFSKEFNPLSGINFILGYFVEICSYLALAMFLTFLLKRSVFVILVLFFFYVIEFIIKIIEFFLHNRFISEDEIESTSQKFYISNYLPLNANSKIIDYPAISINKYLSEGILFENSQLNWNFLIMNIIYIVLFLSLSYLLLKKRDL